MHASVPLHSSWFALLAATALVAACDSSPTGQNDEPIFILVVQPSSARLLPGGRLQLKVTATGAEDRVRSAADVHWSSTDEGVATVTADGVVTAANLGLAEIKASWEGRRGSAIVRVIDRTGPPPCPNFLTAALGPSSDKVSQCDREQ